MRKKKTLREKESRYEKKKAVMRKRKPLCGFTDKKYEPLGAKCVHLVTLSQWFLTWVRSNPGVSVSQFQGFDGKRCWAIEVNKIKITTHILFFQLQKIR